LDGKNGGSISPNEDEHIEKNGRSLLYVKSLRRVGIITTVN